MDVQITEFGTSPDAGLQLADKPVVFKVRDTAGALLGRLYVNRHSVEWRPANFKIGFPKSWEELAALMKAGG